MNTRVFGNNYVGIKLNSVSEIMKYNALNANFSICNESEYYFDEYVEEDDGTGNITEREPTENEKLERILQAFNNGDTLYATFWLDCGEVVPSAATTLQSDFYVGQEVYFMKGNKIQSKFIFRIMLNSVVYYDGSEDYTKIVDGENKSIELSHNKSNIYFLASKRCYESIHNRECVSYGHMEAKKEDEIFATKEELVKHLMED